MNTSLCAATLAVCWSVAIGAQDSTGTIAGTVRDSTGKPIYQAQVSVDATHRARTDSLGRYVIHGVSPDTVRLAAMHMGYEYVLRRHLVITRGIATYADFVLPDGQRPRRAVFIPCPAGALGPDGGTCLPTRQIAYTGVPPEGVGLIRDSATYAAFNRRFPTNDVNRIDWQHEMVLILHYGRHSGMDHTWGFNRAEIREGELVITIGPDSLIGPVYRGPAQLFVNGEAPAEGFVLPRWDRAAYFETRTPGSQPPRPQDWRAVAADTTIRR